MIIKSQSGISEFSLRLNEVNKEQDYHPSVAFTCEAKNEAYSGKLSQIWFDRADLDQFINQLELLFKDERGTATLKAYSEFWLEVKRLDSAGHLSFHIHLENLTSGNLLELKIESDLSVIDSIKSYFNEVLAKMN